MIFSYNINLFLQHPIRRKSSYKLCNLLYMWTKVRKSKLLDRSLDTAITWRYLYWNLDSSRLLGSYTKWNWNNLRFHSDWCDDLVESDVFKNVISNHHCACVLVKRFSEWAFKINTNTIFSIKIISGYLWIFV